MKTKIEQIAKQNQVCAATKTVLTAAPEWRTARQIFCGQAQSHSPSVVGLVPLLLVIHAVLLHCSPKQRVIVLGHGDMVLGVYHEQPLARQVLGKEWNESSAMIFALKRVG